MTEREDAEPELERVTGRLTTDGDEVTPRSERGRDLIHPNEVLKALRQFVEDNKQPTKYVVIVSLTNCSLKLLKNTFKLHKYNHIVIT